MLTIILILIAQFLARIYNIFKLNYGKINLSCIKFYKISSTKGNFFMKFFFVFFRKREEAMSSRVKNIEKITKELLAQILQWEEVRGPFMFAVRTYV